MAKVSTVSLNERVIYSTSKSKANIIINLKLAECGHFICFMSYIAIYIMETTLMLSLQRSKEILERFRPQYYYFKKTFKKLSAT